MTRRTTILTFASRGKHRRQQFEGKEHLVCPVVMMVEGVWNCNEGPVYYSKDQLKLFCAGWNNKPIVPDHPKSEDGTYILVNNAEILEKSRLGFLTNVIMDNNRLTGEAWVEEDAVRSKSPDLYAKILANQQIEVSLGMEADCLIGEGEFNGVKYSMEAVDIRPDHLALITKGKGACSLQDGAGLLVLSYHDDKGIPEELQEAARERLDKMLVNQLSHGRLRDLVSKAIREQGKSSGDETLKYCWIEDIVGNTALVSCGNSDLLEIPFRVRNDVVSLKSNGPFRKVERVVQYRLVDGTVIGNQMSTDTDHVGDNDVKKSELVTLLLANGYEESDRLTLEGYSEEKLAKLAKPYQKAEEKKDVVVVNSDNSPAFDIEKLPMHIRRSIQYGAKLLNEQVTSDTKTVVELSAGSFTESDCKEMEPDNLRRLAVALLNSRGKSPAPKTSSFGDSIDDYMQMFGNTTDFSGMGGQFDRRSAVLNNAESESEEEEEPLGVTSDLMEVEK